MCLINISPFGLLSEGSYVYFNIIKKPKFLMFGFALT
jgi:hypothetical protein